MAYFTSIRARGVGLVEIFCNPQRREWRELTMLADPIDGVRGYLIDESLYLWGSLPLHRDLRPFLKAELGETGALWLGVQIIPSLHAVTVTECINDAGQPLDIAGVEEIVECCLPLTRVIGAGLTLRLIDGTALTLPLAIAELPDR